MEEKLRIIVNPKSRTLQVFTPYEESFVAKMKELGGRWDFPQKCWWISMAHLAATRSAMREIFGADDLGGGDYISLQLTFAEAYGQFRKDAVLYGKVLSHATSRNSGGVEGPDVTYLAGKPESGGSIKNWCSIVPAGAIIRLEKVHKSQLEKQDPPSGLAVEILCITPDSDWEELLAERARLAARIEKIDLLLKKRS